MFRMNDIFSPSFLNTTDAMPTRNMARVVSIKGAPSIAPTPTLSLR